MRTMRGVTCCCSAISDRMRISRICCAFGGFTYSQCDFEIRLLHPVALLWIDVLFLRFQKDLEVLKFNGFAVELSSIANLKIQIHIRSGTEEIHSLLDAGGR